MAKKTKVWYQSKGKLGGGLVMAVGGFVVVYGLVKGQLTAESAMAAVTTFGVGLGVYGVRDNQDSQK